MNDENPFLAEPIIISSHLFLINNKGFVFKINIDSEHIEEIVKNRMAMPKKEDKYSHRRSGKSGQYLEKLNSKTIKAMLLR